MFSSPAPRGPYPSSPSVSDTPQSLRDQYRESESRRAEAVATNHCLQAAVSDLQSEVTVLRQQLLFNQQQQQQPGDTTFFSSSPNNSHYHPQRGFGNVPSIAERLGGRTPPREEGEAPSSWSPSRGAVGGVAAAPMPSSSSSPRRPAPAEVPMGLMQIRAVPLNTDPLRGVRAGTTTTEDWDRRDEIAQRARSCAEDIMRRFVYSLTESKKAKDTLAEVQLEAVRLRSLLDEADSREALLTQMMASYSDALGQQMRVGQEQEQRARSMEALGSGVVVATGSSSSLAITASTGPSSSSSNPATEKALRAALLGDDLSAEEVRSLLQTCTENVAQLDQVRREMLQMRLDEALEENASLKLRLQQQQQQQQGGSAAQGRGARYPVVGSSSSSPLSPHSTNAHSGFHDSDSLLLPKQKKEQPPLLSNERAMLVALMERDQLMQQRLVTMKEMVLEREKRIEQMKVLLAAKK